MPVITDHPKMVDRLARRYIEEYDKGGPSRALRFAKQVLKDGKLNTKVKKRVEELLEIAPHE